MTASDGPSQQNGYPSDETATNTSALIESIYRISLEPQAFDDFMEHWDQHISQAVEALRELQGRAEHSNSLPYAPEVQKHFDIAFRLLEELGRAPAAGFFAEAEEKSGTPKVLVNAKGQVVWFNGRAAVAFGLDRGATLKSLPLDATARAALKDVLSGLEHYKPGPSRASVFRFDNAVTARPVYCLASPTQDRNGETLLLFQEITVGWPDEMASLLAEAFGLSPAENAIAALVADGLSPQDISDARGSSLSTVRTQIKHILAKTGARGQADLVRLLHALIRVSEAQGTPQRIVQGIHPKTLVRLHNRTMPVEVMGDPQGAPVILFHGMLDGCSIKPDMHDLLIRHRLQLIAPVRPWFGQAEGDAGDVPGALHRFADDIAQLCDQRDLGPLVLFGHMAGSLYAFASAARLGDQVKGIVNVAGGVPILSPDQFRVMSRRQRLVAYTARYTPSLLPFILRAGIRQLDFGGEKSFARALYETSPLDRLALEDPEIFAILRQGYHFAIAQGHRAFETDAYHVVRDWTTVFHGSTAPVHLIHGRHDPVVSIGSVRAFATRHAHRVRLTEVPQAGQLVFYREPEIVVRALEAIVAGAIR